MTARRIALIAHNHKKQDLLEWADYNSELLAEHILYATGTTGRMLGDELGLCVTCFQSGPLGGDQQIGAPPASPAPFPGREAGPAGVLH